MGRRFRGNFLLVAALAITFSNYIEQVRDQSIPPFYFPRPTNVEFINVWWSLPSLQFYALVFVKLSYVSTKARTK